MEDFNVLKTSADPLMHFDGDHWAVRLCALALVTLQAPVTAVSVYVAHMLLRQAS